MGAPGAAAVKAGRRTGWAAAASASRPRLDGGEHGATLARSGWNVVRPPGAGL